MYEFLKHAHSGWRWIVFATIVVAIVHAFANWKKGNMYNFKDRKPALFALIATHVQLLLGLGLYFISPNVQFSGETMGNSLLRFFTVEHFAMMLIGITLITIGFSKAKKLLDTNRAYKIVFWFYLIGLVLILSRTPWPFQDLGVGWM